MSEQSSIQTLSRRTTIRLLGGGLMLGTVATAPASARSDTLATELARVRRATRTYRDLSIAENDGYVIGSPYVPQMGFHFVNETLIAPNAASGPVDGLERPPILVYFTTGQYRPAPGEQFDPDRVHDLRLGAVEYAHAGEVGMPGNYFSDEEATRTLKTPEADGWEPIPETPLTALHVWVHRNNPAGVFAPTNPTIP